MTPDRGAGLGDSMFGARPPRGRGGLAGRIALVTTVVAVVAVLVAGVVSWGLVRRAGDEDARRTLAALADAAAANTEGGRGGVVAGRTRTRNQLNALKIDFTFLTRQAGTSGGPADGLAARALTEDERRRVVQGGTVSLTRDVGGTRTLVEARPAAVGGVVLAQALADATIARDAVRRIALALAIGLAVAVAAGAILARLLARPLKNAAAAAHALARGERGVHVPPEGPAEVAEVAAALSRLSTALDTSEGRQREFLLSVSHELRTPLTAITGFAEALADGVTTDAGPTGRTILAEAHRLDRLVTDLLDLARLGAQDFRIDLRPVDLTELLRSAADVWRARCEAEQVRFRAELPPQPVVAVTDPVRVRQIVDGLAENALRVTPAGAPVVLALTADGTGGTIQVRDGGPGLTPDDLAVAFERSVLYERYRGVRKVGTGVGLALVHGLATRLGGTASAGRAPEGGACFAVRLPTGNSQDYPGTDEIPTVYGGPLFGGASGRASGGR